MNRHLNRSADESRHRHRSAHGRSIVLPRCRVGGRTGTAHQFRSNEPPVGGNGTEKVRRAKSLDPPTAVFTSVAHRLPPSGSTTRTDAAPGYSSWCAPRGSRPPTRRSPPCAASVRLALSRRSQSGGPSMRDGREKRCRLERTWRETERPVVLPFALYPARDRDAPPGRALRRAPVLTRES